MFLRGIDGAVCWKKEKDGKRFGCNFSYLPSTLIPLSTRCWEDLYTPSVDKIARLLKTEDGLPSHGFGAPSYLLVYRGVAFSTTCRRWWGEMFSCCVCALRLQTSIFDDRVNHAIFDCRVTAGCLVAANHRAATHLRCHLSCPTSRYIPSSFTWSAFHGIQCGTWL